MDTTKMKEKRFNTKDSTKLIQEIVLAFDASLNVEVEFEVHHVTMTAKMIGRVVQHIQVNDFVTTHVVITPEVLDGEISVVLYNRELSPKGKKIDEFIFDRFGNID